MNIKVNKQDYFLIVCIVDKSLYMTFVLQYTNLAINDVLKVTIGQLIKEEQRNKKSMRF